MDARGRWARRIDCDVCQLARIGAILTAELRATLQAKHGKTRKYRQLLPNTWASMRDEPFFCLHDETCANMRDATVQDPERRACGRCPEASPSSFSVARLVPTSGIRLYTQDLKRWACGRRHEASPSFISALRLLLHRVRVGTMLQHLRTGASHILCTAPGGCLWGHAAPVATRSTPRDCRVR